MTNNGLIFCPLASGSKGNVIFVQVNETKILIDAGLSAKAVEQKLVSIGASLEEIDAILITHEHIDHIQGLKMISQKYRTPIFCNYDTAQAIYEQFQVSMPFKIFTTGETFEFENIFFHPFSILHDCIDPVAFTLQTNQYKIGICTDLGFAPTYIEEALVDSDLLYIEANHEVSFVHRSNRPTSYKERVLSRSGHLSNADCGKLLSKLLHQKLKQVFLAHLSSECNHPEKAIHTVLAHLPEEERNISIDVAWQDQVSKKIIWN